VALLWQADPSLVGNVDKTESDMDHSAIHLTDFQAVGNCRGPSIFQDDTFGYGLLNLLKATQQHQGHLNPGGSASGAAFFCPLLGCIFASHLLRSYS
jgi:hypothetical protein